MTALIHSAPLPRAGHGDDGVDYGDRPNLASELQEGRSGGTWIEIPDDENGGLMWIRLRVLALVIVSFDWLENGEFGPFAMSVQARHPCFKCKWTANCACAFMARGDPRRSTVKHSDDCRGLEPRTHEETMRAVRELRAWTGTKTALTARRTELGIFSNHFASEYLLDDIIKGTTVDIMHVNACGMTRYLLSWLTDEQIPAEYSWHELNQRKNMHRFKRGRRVPNLERTKGSPRGSKSIHLNAGQMLDFALASPDIMAPLVKHTGSPAWLCWLAHVRMLRFITRDSFMRHEQNTVNELVQEFMIAFESVPEWAGYEKPKMHLNDELDLLEYGPFTAYWCMSWEGYVQVLKRLFEMTNYNSGPLSVGKIWAMKSVLHYRDSARASWHEDRVDASSDFITDMSTLANSRLVQGLMDGTRQVPTALRWLSQVSRARVEIKVNDWVLVRRDVHQWVGRVSEMAQIVVTDAATGATVSVVRLWVRNSRRANLVEGLLHVNSADQRLSMLVCFESEHVDPVACLESTDPGCLRFEL